MKFFNTASSYGLGRLIKRPVKLGNKLSEQDGKFSCLQQRPDVLEHEEQKVKIDAELQIQDHINLDHQQQNKRIIAIQKQERSSSLQRAIHQDPLSLDRKRKRDLEPVDGSIGILQNDEVEIVTKRPRRFAQTWDHANFAMEVGGIFRALAPFMGEYPPFNGDDYSVEEVD